MDPIKEAMFLGLGALSLSREKTEELINELVQRGEMSAKERAEMVERMRNEAETQTQELEAKVTASARKVLTDMGLPTRKDFQDLSKRLDGLEKAIPAKKRSKSGTRA